MDFLNIKERLESFVKSAEFKSKAQRRYFYWKKSKGDPNFTQKVIDEFESDTPKKIPEKVKKKKT